MTRYTSGISTILVLLMIISMMGCSGLTKAPLEVPEGTDKLICEEDADCICGGRDVDGSCFLGNKQYYETYVNKKLDCPDFCTGITGNMMTRCVANQCIQTFECITDSDCDVGGCSNNKCLEVPLH